MMLALDSRTVPPLHVTRDVVLARSRAHEVTGASRRLFALLTGAATEGTILWLYPRWWTERLMGDGIAPLVEPGRLVFGRCRGAVDILWCAEEALRAGSVPLVVAELPAPPSLTPVRRLHLAAQAGAEANGAPPLCLLLTPEEGGAPGVETRWQLAPAPGWAIDGRARWRLKRLRARVAPPAEWEMRIEDRRMVLRSGGADGPGTLPGAVSTPTDVAALESLVPIAR